MRLCRCEGGSLGFARVTLLSLASSIIRGISISMSAQAFWWRTPSGDLRVYTELSQENIFAVVSRSVYAGGSFNYPPREEVFMSLQALCGDASVDDHIRKVACSAHNLGIQRFYFFTRLLFHSVFDYVCGAVRQSKALSFEVR